MRRVRSLLLIATLPLLSGCEFPVRSLYPFYLDEDVIQDSRLVGTWTQEDPNEVWEFSETERKGYRCVIRDSEGKSAVFEAHLIEIHGKMFLDLFLQEPNPAMSFHEAIHLLPVHTFAYVTEIEPALRLSFPDQDWLLKLLKKSPGAIRHEALGSSDLILTGSTEALQRFWLDHLDNEEAFIEPVDLQRVKDSGD